MSPRTSRDRIKEWSGQGTAHAEGFIKYLSLIRNEYDPDYPLYMAIVDGIIAIVVFALELFNDFYKDHV